MIPGMQMTLFDCGYPPRPKMYDGDVTELVLDELMPKVLAWMRSTGDSPDAMSEDYVDEVRDDIRSAIELEDDSYEIVRSLEHDGWSVDRDLIDVMDDAAMLRIRAHDSRVERWVLQHGVLPKFSLGQLVIFKWRHEVKRGVITRLNVEHGTYAVFSEELNHVKKGPGSHAVILPYEDVVGEQSEEDR